MHGCQKSFIFHVFWLSYANVRQGPVFLDTVYNSVCIHSSCMIRSRTAIAFRDTYVCIPFFSNRALKVKKQRLKSIQVVEQCCVYILTDSVQCCWYSYCQCAGTEWQMQSGASFCSQETWQTPCVAVLHSSTHWRLSANPNKTRSRPRIHDKQHAKEQEDVSWINKQNLF